MADKHAATEASTVDRTEYVKALVRRSVAVKEKLIAEYTAIVVSMADICIESLVAGGKLLLCGNGGSAADAQHLAAELLVRLRPDVNRDGVPAIALATDMSSITACGNDYSYEVFYERMVRTLGRPGDVLIGITTPGKSPNVIKPLKPPHSLSIRPLV